MNLSLHTLIKKHAAITLVFLILLSSVFPAVPINGAKAPEESQTSVSPPDENTTGSNEKADNKNPVSFHSQAKSALLMEASTGQVIFEQDADTKRPPASITKIMTLILIFDAMNSGTLKPEDSITVSEHAASMGGSQVFLETGETQTADTMIKCIAVASGNDACVAMAEHIAGTEEAFVEKMNKRAVELGMKNTHFVNCCGLDAESHYTTARDIAIMSRELIIKYPDIFRYTTIWMDKITHVTRRGSQEFGLSNTNKLIRQYNGATGLKTGSTSKAGFCLSGTASRNDISLIAVVMACNSSKDRVRACSALLDYGFANCHLYEDKAMPALPDLPVKNGKSDSLPLMYDKEFSCVTTNQTDTGKIRKKMSIKKAVTAPVRKGQSVGTLTYYYGDTVLGKTMVLAGLPREKAGYRDCAGKLIQGLIF